MTVKEYKTARQTLFDLVPSSPAVAEWLRVFDERHGEWNLDPAALVRQCRDFPLNRMKVGQSFLMHRRDHWPGRFVDVRQRIREQNKNGAAYFVAIWINDRQTLEVARVT